MVSQFCAICSEVRPRHISFPIFREFAGLEFHLTWREEFTSEYTLTLRQCHCTPIVFKSRIFRPNEGYWIVTLAGNSDVKSGSVGRRMRRTSNILLEHILFRKVWILHSMWNGSKQLIGHISLPLYSQTKIRFFGIEVNFKTARFKMLKSCA